MKQMPYMAETWFGLLTAAVQREKGIGAAARLGVSPVTVSQVINGSGEYGKGTASTARLAEKVRHTYGSFECPHLSQVFEESRVVTADECRGYAHRPPPVGSTGQMQHWRSCQGCAHRVLTAPPEPRVPVPRKRRASNDPTAAAAAPSTTQEPPCDPQTSDAT